MNLVDIKVKLDKAKESLLENKGKLEQARKELENYGCSTIEQAEEMRQLLDSELTEKKAELEEKYALFNKLYGEYL